ncbi:MAG: hypothetical protein G01um101456_639 [Parcubacteria group bacterium Gr01-1014_56]|nr:MAG: hypothetical protein G01um101456_639 [Parcubacteria group bacterium Gr01-1014_56]
MHKEKECERILKALANERRLCILSFLKKHKEGSVGTIAEEINLSFKATSKHLSVLEKADMLEKEHRSNQMFFRIGSNFSAMVRRAVSFL